MDNIHNLGTSPMRYYNLSPGDHSVNIKAQAIILGQPLKPAIGQRNFTINKQGNNLQ